MIGVTIGEMLRRVVDAHGDREAVVCVEQKRRVTYNDLWAQTSELAKGLIGMGVERGDRVGVWSTDNVEWVLLQIATARVGAVLVNINPAYRVGELKHALALAQVQCVFAMPSFKSSGYCKMLCEIAPSLEWCSPGEVSEEHLPELRHVVVFDPSDAHQTERFADGFWVWGEVLDKGEGVSDEDLAAREESLDTDDPVNIQFTSGTTGFPKAVVLTHHNIVNNASATASVMRFTEKDRLCVPLPFYHCFGMVVSNLMCMTRGACIVIPSSHFDVGATLRAIQDERCTAVHGVPTMFVAELEHHEFASMDLSTLRTGIMAGAPCPPELMRRVMQDMGCREILIGYGQTEASPLSTLTRHDDSFEKRVETVGTALPHQEVKIVDPETGRTCYLDEVGEICFRGYHVMRGYYRQDEATREAIDEAHWLHSGDLGSMDADGYVKVTGRLKDMIIRGGENIYPAEIEAMLYEKDEVQEAAVFGIPDEKYGEEIGAWVQLREGAQCSAEQIQQFVKANMAHYKMPRRVWFVDEFPMTVTGKIQKNRIREMVVAEGDK